MVDGGSVEVSILGTTFTVQSRYDPRYLGEVIAYLKERIREIQASAGTQEPLKIALLAALNVVDELLRKREGDSREIEELTERLIERIDRSLVEN
jgi:cell division protein ZapA (FtsZ GTPase activity inhibitor)